MHRTLFALLIAFAVLAAACGDDDGATTTTSGATTTTADAGGEPTTTAAETTTTAAAETTTTTASDGATETTSAPPTDGSAAAVKANAAAEAVPNGWTVVITDEMTEPPADDILFEACLEEGSFDLDNLNAVSEAAVQVRATSPIGGATPVPSNGSIEARIFQSEALAAEAYTVLETILGTTIGRECIASASLEAIGAELPAGASVDYRVGEVLIPTGDFGVSIEYAITIEGQTLVAFIDLVAYRDGACTLYGAFTGFQEPFPALVAEAMFQAAIDAI